MVEPITHWLGSSCPLINDYDSKKQVFGEKCA
jgi:hypothetical protein